MSRACAGHGLLSGPSAWLRQKQLAQMPPVQSGSVFFRWFRRGLSENRAAWGEGLLVSSLVHYEVCMMPASSSRNRKP